MANLEGTSRVGRSQGASIFWGLISVCFAAAACFYYWKNHENETTANVMRDQVLQLREENESLNSQKEHLQASKTEAENQLKTREELVQEKETQLAAEENRIEAMAHQSQNQSQQNLSQVAVVKKFNDLIHKLSKDADVVERAGRPVWRIPNAQLFEQGEIALNPEGKALLTQIAQGLNGQLDNFELRIVAYTDSDAETAPGKDEKKDPSVPEAKPHAAPSWALTASRAANLSRFFRDQTSLSFANVMVMGRGDSEPVVSGSGENHARNRRVEITVTPLPIAFHSPDLDHDKVSDAKPVNPLAPPPDPPAPTNKEKAKDKKTDKDKPAAKQP